MQNKMNTFNDFIDSCEYLTDQGYTSKGNIAANGGSAGGLLIGAVTNMRPDLFKAIIIDVPFVDVINTMSDDTLPLTPPEWEEWGNPIQNKSDFEYIMSYSPYDNVNDLLLNMRMHAGASKKYESIREVAFNYSFILKVYRICYLNPNLYWISFRVSRSKTSI